MYELWENGKLLHHSAYFERLLNFTAPEHTTNAEIFYAGESGRYRVWVQRPGQHIK